MKKVFLLLLFIIGIGSGFTQNAFAQYSKEDYNVDSVAKLGLAEIQFVGTGDIQLAVAEGKEFAASTGLGAVFWRIWPNKCFEPARNVKTGLELQLEVKIDVASTTDTIYAQYNNANQLSNARAFGSYILSPVSSGQATNVSSLWYFKPYDYNVVTGVTSRKLWFIKNIDGMELGFAAANQVWRYDADNSVNVSVVAWRGGFFHEFLPDNIRRQKGYSIRFGANYVGRSVQGDLGRNETVREKMLFNKETTYHGLEFVLSLRLKNIRAEAALPIMHIGAKNSVPGLSGSQFVASISFVGGFPLSIN